MKTLARNVLADLMHASGVTAVLRRVKSRSLVILCYHRVLPADALAEHPFPDLIVAPEAFACHVAYCCEHYECLPLREALDRVRSGTRSRKPLLTFTFDDGYADNFKYARPVLNTFGVRATFFVISSLVGSITPPWYDRLGRALMHLRDLRNTTAWPSEKGDMAQRWLAEQCGNIGAWSVARVVSIAKALDSKTRFAVVEQASRDAILAGWRDNALDCVMKWKELKQLESEGHEMASHTRSHPILTQSSLRELATELEASKADLERMLHQPVVSLSYPNGDHDDIVVSAAHRAGYRYAVTTQPGLNARGTDPLRLRRIFVSQERTSQPTGKCSTNILEAELTGVANTVFARWLRRGGSS